MKLENCVESLLIWFIVVSRKVSPDFASFTYFFIIALAIFSKSDWFMVPKLMLFACKGFRIVGQSIFFSKRQIIQCSCHICTADCQMVYDPIYICRGCKQKYRYQL